MTHPFDTRQNSTLFEHGPALFDDVDLLCLDAGNTVVFLDHEVVSVTARSAGYALDVEALVRCEGEAKRAVTPATKGRSIAQPLPGAGSPVGHGAMPATWSAFMGTRLRGRRRARRAVDRRVRARPVGRARAVQPVEGRVPEGLRAGLDEVRAAGVRVCVVSNSEGQLEALFERVGLEGAFDHVIDSALVGVEKPDPAIFELALTRFGVPPRAGVAPRRHRSATDVGARAAGVRAALIDPWAHYEGMLDDVPRVEGALEVARALTAKRAQRRE